MGKNHLIGELLPNAVNWRKHLAWLGCEYLLDIMNLTFWYLCSYEYNRLTAIQSLEAILVSGGGFMPLGVRALVDSISAACLETIISAGSSPLATTPSIKMAVLQLGAACLSTPWPIGTSSSIHEHLRACAHHCRMDDSNTSMVAASILRLCDCMATPRVPALHIDTQSHRLELASFSAASLVNDIQKADIEQQERASEAANPRKEHKGTNGEELKGERTKKKRVVEDIRERSGRKAKVSGSSRGPDDQNSDERHDQESASSTLQQEVTISRDSSEQPCKEKGKGEELTSTVKPAEIEERGVEDDEEMDFLPEIVDDDGPDEDDI